jgi:hypothetical protein
MTDRIAIGHRIDRSTVAVLGGEVRGANELSRAEGRSEATREFAGVRMESGAATSAPYTDANGAERQAGQYVSVGGGLPLTK